MCCQLSIALNPQVPDDGKTEVPFNMTINEKNLSLYPAYIK